MKSPQASSTDLGYFRAGPAAGDPRHRIVIVGGGAGGLELATHLGDSMGRSGNAYVMLVDRSPTHLWKPLLHEVAAGSMDPHAHQLEYIAQARWHDFEFQQGELIDLDRARKIIMVSAVSDADGVEIWPAREIPYDSLVLAIGSVTNFFGVPGASEHAIAVDNLEQAEFFRRRLFAACMRVQSGLEQADFAHPHINIVVIGGGATGIELAAELRGTAQVLGAYGLNRLDPVHDISITIVESGSRILPPLQERIALHTADLLKRMNIAILTNEKVVQVQKRAVLTESGQRLPADIVVWAGGIKVPKVLAEVGLPVNKLGQVIVTQTLQSIIDPDIFALGDCASCPWPKGESSGSHQAAPAVPTHSVVPPRAQAAHQQAKFLLRAFRRRLAGCPLPGFTYRDHGSLVSLGRYETVGNLMVKFLGRPVGVEGVLARLLYVSLYRQHVMALHGFSRMVLDAMAGWLRRKTTPRIKLH